jgi:hypothetical protein
VTEVAGIYCPSYLTYSGYPVLRPHLHRTHKKLTDSSPLDRILSRKYNQQYVAANIKSGLTIG